MSQKKKVIVVGGGFAGLTAARKLLKEGFDVELIEKRDVLGGKWSAWKDQDNDWIETGLHVFFGAYEEIFDLMKELNIYDRVHWKEHVLTYTLDKGERFEFRTIDLPSPFHLLPAVFKNTYFTIKDKLSLGKALFPMLFGSQEYYDSQDQYTYQQWHQKFEISDKMLKKMFLPMTLALKFLPPEMISAKIVLDVTGTFLRKNTASRIGFLKGSPEEHLTAPIAEDILKRGGKIAKGLKLQEVKLNEKEEIGSLVFSDENSNKFETSADYYVFALPIHNLKKVMPSVWKEKYDYFKGLNEIESVPVYTLHLWLDRQVSEIDNVLFCPDGHIPVYADLGNTTKDYYNEGKSRFQFCVAPAFDLLHLTDEEITNKIWNDIKGVFPKTAPEAKILKSKVVRVPKSVYWPSPSSDKLRVPQKSPISNLALAGGYTKQKFYDSMEGAVRSGNRAADAIIANDRSYPWWVKD
ncbi:MAG: FAD-dependent oxidoreductase [Candidatus Caenarcaniphilales bacterium]|nr:FAD-dependent oxidoreductase [Candidatus Caenarcaniphilales bacterium]